MDIRDSVSECNTNVPDLNMIQPVIADEKMIQPVKA